MDNMKNKTSKINRWRLELSEYKYEIKYKKGVLNPNYDQLFRVNEPRVEKPGNLEPSKIEIGLVCSKILYVVLKEKTLKCHKKV